MANRELDIPWEQVKLAAVAGVPFVALARQYDLKDKSGKPSTGAIRVRAMREKWPVPSRILHKAKRAAKQANEALEAARKAQPPLNPSQANSPNVLRDTIYQDTERGDIEPGLDEPGFMGEFPTNQGGNGNSETRIREGSGNQVPGFGGNSANNGGMNGILVTGSGGESGISVPRNIGGNKGLLSIGEVGNASQSLQTSESLAATLIQNHMAQLANESIMQALTRAHASIHAAPAQLPIATIADLRSAMKLAQEATGLDSKQNNQTLNILVHPTPKAGTWNFHDSPESLTIDAE